MTSLGYVDADGISHDVLVRQTPDGNWQVLDTWPNGTHLIETLDGREDDRPQAEAVARDYAANPARLASPEGHGASEAIPEQGGADADSDRRPRPQPRQSRARGAALPHPAG